MKHRKIRITLIRPFLLLACFCMLLAGSCMGAAAAPAGETQQIVYLTASVSTHTIIEPEAVAYEKGQTIREILKASGHEFAGLDQGAVYSIDGVTGNFMRFYDGGAYDLDASPESLSVICFTEAENAYSEEMVNLICTAGEYRAAADYKNMQNYVQTAKAWVNALTGIRQGVTPSEAKTLSDGLKAAQDAYRAIFQGTKYAVTFQAEQNGQPAKNLSVTMTDGYGNRFHAEGGQIQVVAGSYKFSVSDGGWNRTEGTLLVDGAETVSLTLPSGEWFGEIKLLNGNKQVYSYTQDSSTHKAVYQIPDQASESGLYLNAEAGTLPDLNKTMLRTTYIDTTGQDTSDLTRSWNSQTTSLARCLKTGMEGRTFQLEGRYEDTQGNLQIQSYEIVIERYPTLRSLSVKAENTELLSGFDGETKNYEIESTSSVLHVTGIPFLESGCTITVDGTERSEVTLTEEEQTIEICVKHETGKENRYQVKVRQVEAVSVTLQLPQDTTAEIRNEAGGQILPSQDGTYALVPNQNYTYVATSGTWYHSSAVFQATAGAVISVAKPDTQDVVTAFGLFNKTTVSSRKEFALTPGFSKETHQYEVTVSDHDTAIAAQATLKSGAGYKAYVDYIQQKDQAENSKEITLAYGSSNKATNLPKLIAKSGYGTEMTLRAEKTSGNVTYYQEYEIKVKKELHLSSLSVTLEDETPVDLYKENGTKQKFDRAVSEYWISLERGTQTLILNGMFPNEENESPCDGGFSAVIQGQRYTSLKDISCSLGADPDSWTEQDLEIRVEHADSSNEAASYVLHIKQVDPVTVTVNTTPAQAKVFMVNTVSGKTVAGNQHVFYLTPGQTYRYQVTCSGYIGQKEESYVVPEQGGTVDVTLQKAPENASLTKFDAEWPGFRYDADNNGVVNSPVPTSADDAVLYWATKVGDGYGSNAAGCPILVGDSIYVYGGDKIYKVNKMTGKIEKEGRMDRSSSFGINTPTYADGMIFVGLANGGVQAFDADSLKSLWIYNDERKGQPNCPIICKDGYLYTGFWLGEEKEANYVCLSITDEDPSQEKEEKLASWTYAQKGGFYWAGACVEDDFLLISTDDGCGGYLTGYSSLLSLDLNTGAVKSRMKMEETGDIRCSIVKDDTTGRYYFVSKGGYFYGVEVTEDGIIKKDSLQKIKLNNYADDKNSPPMSTSTPTIYNGRAYIGVSGLSQFGAYSGHNLTVIDLDRMNIAYTVRTQGYPQTSGMLTTSYEKTNGKVYVYFFDNYTPGKLRVLTDKKGWTEPEVTETEVYNQNGREMTCETAPVLFTPDGEEAQYALCSPIVDTDGTIYFKNDSAKLMALGSTIEKLTIDQKPEKLSYEEGEKFDAKGMKVTAHYTNGTSRDVTDYVTYSMEPLTAEDTQFEIRFPYVKYQNKDGEPGAAYAAPSEALKLTITGAQLVLGDVTGDGIVTAEDAVLVYQFAMGTAEASDDQKKAADVNGDGQIDSLDAAWIYGSVNQKITEFPQKIGE